MQFLKLGLTSFGGPLVHMAIFRQVFVEKKAWFSEQQFSQWILLTQFMPGPSSSQLGFLIGYQRGGWQGAIAAFIGFTLPSALIMVFFALGVFGLLGLDSALQSALAGLVILAAALLIQASWQMGRKFCQGLFLKGVALFSALLLVLIPHPLTMIGLLLFLALSASGFKHALKLKDIAQTAHHDTENWRIPTKVQAQFLLLFVLSLLILFPLLALSVSEIRLVDSLYRAGALVWGGGQVVLPYLYFDFVESGVMDAEVFLSGYALAQSLPGPMFSFATYLGALIGGGWGALLATLAIFLPGLLLIIGILPYYRWLITQPAIQAGLLMLQAGLVGLLISVLITPVLPLALTQWAHAGLLALNLIWLMQFKQSLFWLIPFNLGFIALF